MDYLNMVAVTQGHKCAIINTMVVSSIPTSGSEIIIICISCSFHAVTRQKAALSSVIQHAMPQEFGERWETEVS